MIKYEDTYFNQLKTFVYKNRNENLIKSINLYKHDMNSNFHRYVEYIFSDFKQIYYKGDEEILKYR